MHAIKWKVCKLFIPFQCVCTNAHISVFAHTNLIENSYALQTGISMPSSLQYQLPLQECIGAFSNLKKYLKSVTPESKVIQCCRRGWSP